MTTPATTPTYEIARHCAALPERFRDRFAYFARSADYSHVIASVRNAMPPKTG